MRILFICDTMGSGGAERVIATLSNGFIDNDYEVSILMLSDDANGSFYKLDDRVSLFKLNSNNSKIFIKAKLIRRAVIENKPDIVISFLSYVCIYTWWALKNTKIPYIVSERNDPNQREKIKQLLLNMSFKKAVGCVFQTEDALKWYGKIAKNKGVIIHNPVNLDYCPDKIASPKKQILYVGRFSDQKNCLMLLDAFDLFIKNHPDYTLKMYGSGQLESQLKEHIKERKLDDKVILLPNSKTWQQDECDSAMFALSSKYEGMPNVLAEALCLGIPSVATDCTIGGPKELKKIFGESLILSKQNDAHSFAEAMEEGINVKRLNPIVPDALKITTIVKQWMTLIKCILESDNNYVR